MLIYKITNKVNGKVYIGQTTKTLEHRKEGHLQAARNGLNRHLYNAIRKYGEDNFVFEKICTASSRSELNYLEAKYILEYDSVRNGYNMGYGGDNNVMFSNKVKTKHDAIMRSDDVRLKISASMKEYRKNNPFTPEHRRKISEKMKGNHHSAGQKISQAHLDALNRSHYKAVHCVDHNGKVVAHFNTVQSAAKWWFENGYDTVNDWHQLCNTIKSSSKRDIYIKGLLWVYDNEGGDNHEKVD